MIHLLYFVSKGGEPMAATRYFEYVISADSHLVEPHDIWWNAIGHKFGDRTPRVIDEYQGRIDDPYGADMIPLIGADRVMWGSDFPHIRSIGLEAQEHVNKMFEVLPIGDQEKVVGGNAAKMFNVDLSSGYEGE